MSAVQFIVKSIQDMSKLDREAVFAAFAMDPPMASPKSAAKITKVAKKPRANAGQLTAWAEFSNQKRLEHKDAIDAWIAERIAAAKVLAVGFAIDATLRLKARVGSMERSEKRLRMSTYSSNTLGYMADDSTSRSDTGNGLCFSRSLSFRAARLTGCAEANKGSPVRTHAPAKHTRLKHTHRQRGARAAVHAVLALEHARAQRLREAAHGLADQALKVLNH